MSRQRRTAAPVLPFDARTRRILELRDLIRRGAYQPDPREVAAAILLHAERFPAPAGAEPRADAFDPARFVVRRQPAPVAEYETGRVTRAG